MSTAKVAELTLFRVAQISDLHFASENSRKGYLSRPGFRKKIEGFFEALAEGNSPLKPMSFNPAAAVRLAEELEELHSRKVIHCVLATGDLATTGAPADIAVARRFFEGRALVNSDQNRVEKVPSLVDSKCPIFCIPGNHDRYEGLRCRPKSTAFEEKAAFGNFWDKPFCPKGIGKAHSRVRVNELKCTGQTVEDSLLLYRIDLSLIGQAQPGFPHYLGQGVVSADILKQIDTMTKSAKRKWGAQTPMIWAVHFSPGSCCPSLALQGADELLKKAADLHVQYIFAGHTHEAKEESVTVKNSKGVDVAIKIYTSGTTTGYEDELPLQYAIHEFWVGNGTISRVKTSEFVFDDYEQEFLPAA